MKPQEMVKIFPALKGKKIRIWMGKSVQEVTLQKIIDDRTYDSQGAVRVEDSGGLTIWPSQIDKIELIP